MWTEINIVICPSLGFGSTQLGRNFIPIDIFCLNYLFDCANYRTFLTTLSR